MRDLANIFAVFEGRDGAVTKAMYDELMAFGPVGVIAVNIFRIQKNSHMAKGYKRRQSTAAAYDTKDWAIDNICKCLTRHNDKLGLKWGWGTDGNAKNFEHVLYIELPTGQVSFHNRNRRDGPDYPGKWDGMKGTGTTRICKWIAEIFNAQAQRKTPSPGTRNQEASPCHPG